MNLLINNIKNDYKDIPDLLIKEISYHKKTVYILFLETLSSSDRINEYILKKFINAKNKKNIFKLLGSNTKIVNENEINEYLYNGYTIIINENDIYAIETKIDINRSIPENNTEPSIKGPKNAFIENFQTNIGLIKKRCKTPHLKTKTLVKGKVSKSNIGILYIDNICKIENVNKVYNLLDKINVDLINDIEDLKKYLGQKSIFPTAIITERPDRCANALCEGKIIIICDESPNAMIVPAFLVDFINPYADRYNKNVNINFTKLIRMICFLFSIIIPAFYISIICYNEEAIPTSLVINFAKQRENIPFPSIIECFIMLIICEILRESDLRFPNKYGSAISILGALVLGDAAVSAGLVTPIMIIITSFTYITSLIFSEYEIGNAIRTYRFIFLILSALFGLYGLMISFLFLIINLCDIKSLDIPYTFPLSPFDKSYFKDIFFKMKNFKRSKMLSNNIYKEK